MVRRFSVIELMGMSSADPGVSHPFVYASDYDALAAELADVVHDLGRVMTREQLYLNQAMKAEARVKELEALVRRFKALSVDDGDEIHDQIWEDANKLVPQSETQGEG